MEREKLSYTKDLFGKQVSHLLIIAVLGLLAYSNTFNAPFQWDEEYFIEKNPIVKDLNYFLEPSKAEGLEYYGALKNRYIGYLTFALNYKLHGLDVRGYHLFNISIHLLNAFLVYFLVALTFKTHFLENSKLKEHSGYIAFFTSLLFVSHPIQTEAVTYIFQRLASLAAFFYLFSMVLYIKWRLGKELSHPPAHFNDVGAKPPKGEKDFNSSGLPGTWGRSPHNIKRAGGWVPYILSLLSAVLAMKTKENAFTLPLMITLYEFSFFRGSVKRRILWLIPLLLTMLIIPLTLIGFDKPAGEIIGSVESASRGYAGVSRTDYLFTQFRAIMTYIRLLFLPVNQNIDYDYPLYQSFFVQPVILSFSFLSAVFAFGIYLFHRARGHERAVRLIGFGIF
jgi:hypothetical protein